MSQGEKLSFQSAKYGEITLEQGSVVMFPEGVPGFERFKQYGLLEVEEEMPFLRLLSTDEPDLGFVLINPMLIWPDYNPQLGEEDLEGLEIQEAEEMAVYCIVTLSKVPQEVTVNLKGPIFLNTRTMNARQMILMDERYHTKHSIMGTSQESA